VLGLLPPGVLVAVRASLDTPGRVFFEARLLYFTMPVVVGLAAMAAVWRWRAVPRSHRSTKHLWPGAVAAVVLTTIVFALVPPQMRVQFDETSLVSVSQNMHLQRAAVLATGAVPFDGDLVPIENMMDKRPPLFAFLVSLLHDVSGYRIENAFAVNAGLLATALLLVFAAARRHLGLIGALAAPFLLLAVPLTTLVATSAGFELLAAVLFTLVLLSALDFVRQPDTVRFVGFLASGVLFAESRYESLPALGLVAVIVAWSVRRRFRPDRRALVALAACPALVTPLVFLLLHSRNPNFYPEAGGQDLVSLQHGLEHAGPFLEAWFWPLFDNALPACSRSSPYSRMAHGFAVAAPASPTPSSWCPCSASRSPCCAGSSAMCASRWHCGCSCRSRGSRRRHHCCCPRCSAVASRRRCSPLRSCCVACSCTPCTAARGSRICMSPS
jgi:hypothetical protein